MVLVMIFCGEWVGGGTINGLSECSNLLLHCSGKKPINNLAIGVFAGIMNKLTRIEP